MIAASGIAASVTHRLTSHACSSSSRCDGGRVKAQQQDMVALPPRRLKTCQQQGNAGVSAAWTTLVAVVSQVQAALAEEEESVVGKDAASAYARMTGGGSQAAPEPEDAIFNFELPEVKLELPQLDFKAPDFQVPQADLSGIGAALSGVAEFVADNPLVVFGGIAAVAIPLLVAQVLGRKPDPYGTVSAKVAYEKLSDTALTAQLVDIRPEEDVNTEGTPDLRAFKKRVFQVPYKLEGQEDEAAAAAALVGKLKAKFKKPEETTLYIVDRFDGNSLAVAKQATENGFLAAYAVKGGAEGPNGWRLSELPWLAPRKGFKLDLSSLKEVLDSFGSESGSVVPAAVGVAAAAAAGVVVFSEAETALQLLGSAALLQLFVKKLLFAKDREQTFKQVKELLDTKVAPNGLVDDFKNIGKTLASTAEQIASQVVGQPATALPVASYNGVATYERGAAKTEESNTVGGGDDAASPAPISGEVAKTEVEVLPAVTEAAAEPAPAEAAAEKPVPAVEAPPALEEPKPAPVEVAASSLDATPGPVAVGSSSGD